MMKSASKNYTLEEIKVKMQELLQLVKLLPLEDKLLIKNFLKEKIHEILFLFDNDRNLPVSENNDGLIQETQEIVMNKTEKVIDPPLQDTSAHGFASKEIENLSADIRSVTSMHMPGDGSNPVDELAANQFLIGSFTDLEQTQPNEGLSQKFNDVLKESKDDVDNKPAIISGDAINDLDDDDVTQQLMDEIDDIKPKSNMPFVKDGTPDTTCTSTSDDVSSLLSFLPQLSPYIKFDLKDSNLGDKEGYIHFTVERADGSVQNLKLAAATASTDECTQYENEKVTTDRADKQLTLIQKDLMDKENENILEKNSSQKSPQTNKEEANKSSKIKSTGKDKPRGRPRKQEIFHSKILENGQKVFMCKVCDSSTQTHHAMIVHMRKHSGERPFVCETCGKSFTTKGNLKHHAVAHKNDKPWKCSHCDKTFKEKRVLLIHQRTHTGEKPFKCNICEKTFSQSGVLKEHLLVHSGQKPHLCDLCGQEFRGYSSLRAHKLRHIQKKDFKCDRCEKEFICKADLNRHYMTHTGARPFMCSVCPKSFTRLNYLKEHLNVHYGKKPFSCSECNAAFPDNISLHRHKRKHKSETENTNKQANQSELRKQLIPENQSVKLTPNLPSFEITQSTQAGDQSFQLVLDENTTVEDIQKLQSLLSSTNNLEVTTDPGTSQPAQPVYQVMCVNPDTQEIVEQNRNSQVVVEGQSAYLSAINMLANATNQQFSFSIQ